MCSYIASHYCLRAFCIPVAFSLVKIVVLSNAVEVGLLVAVIKAVSLTVMLIAEVLSAKNCYFYKIKNTGYICV